MLVIGDSEVEAGAVAVRKRGEDGDLGAMKTEDFIARAVEESADGVSTAANNTGELVKEISFISDEMGSNTEVANELKEESSVFVRL